MPAEPVQLFSGKKCEWDEEDCTVLLPARGEDKWSPNRKYCPQHSVMNEVRTKRRKREKKTDKPPVNVNITPPSPGRGTRADASVAKVTAGATGMAQMIAALIAMGGDEVCAKAINDGAANWGKAMGELSRYQPALVKVFAPTGEATGQFFAWVGVFAATMGLTLPVLVHHGAVPPELAAKITGVSSMSATVTNVVSNADAGE